MRKMTMMRLVCAAGLAVGAGSSAMAGSTTPELVHGSGATLLRALLIGPAGTNDFLDVDGDGVSTPMPDQLAPNDPTPGAPFPTGMRWQVQYRSTGSVRGLQELIDFSITPAVGADGVEIAGSVATEGAWANRVLYVNNGGTPGTNFNAANPGGSPVRHLLDGSFDITTSTNPETAGINIVFATIDVPVSWGVIYDGEGNPKAKPTDPGYGQSGIISLNKDGTLTEPPFEQILADLGALNTNAQNPDNLTVFDYSIAMAPVAAIVNYGVGYQEMTISDLKWLSMTGRLKNGANLMAVTRDTGSGTRNAFQNSLCLDPSWGAGENIGPRADSSSTDLLGPNYQPSNKGGSSRAEGATINHRLAIGHTGVERGVSVTSSNQWLLNGRLEVLGVKNDINGGGTVFARPNIDNCLDNGPDGYRIFGPSVYASLGDIYAEPNDPMNGFFGDGNGNPRMSNSAGAAYLLNIFRSIQAFKDVPFDVENVGSPGEYAASLYILTSGADFVQQQNCPCEWEPNPGFNAELQDVIRQFSELGNPRLDTYNKNGNGIVPTRTANTTYTDNNGGSFYNLQNGGTLAYGAANTARNRISGDFNGDNVRNAADTQDLVDAWRFRNGQLAMWRPTEGVSIEIIGDFTGDGNFNAADVRYWADGLVIEGQDDESKSPTGTLSRELGFTLVDQAFPGGNFFGTTLAAGATYDAGDSRADVAGPSGRVTKGFVPIGFDGVVDAWDIDYVCANFGDWSINEQAALMDLSCDMNGDLLVDGEDIRVIVEDILETDIGDVDLDGDVDEDDLSIAAGNLDTEGGWGDGDVNCDGVVDEADIAIINGFLCPTDLNGDQITDFGDLNILLGNYNMKGMNLPGDFDGNGTVDFGDLNTLLGVYNTPCDEQ